MRSLALITADFLLVKTGDQIDASKKRKSESVQEDDASTFIGDSGALIRGLLEKINPALLDLLIEADSLKKSNQSTLRGYLNDSQGSLFVVHNALRSDPIDSDKELAITVINSIVAQRKAKLPPAEGVVFLQSNSKPDSSPNAILIILSQSTLNSRSCNSTRVAMHCSKLGLVLITLPKPVT